MTENAYDVLKERGFIAQCTNEETVRNLIDKEKITFYIGFEENTYPYLCPPERS